jgi:hypothetical protein
MVYYDSIRKSIPRTYIFTQYIFILSVVLTLYVMLCYVYVMLFHFILNAVHRFVLPVCQYPLFLQYFTLCTKHSTCLLNMFRVSEHRVPMVIQSRFCMTCYISNDVVQGIVKRNAIWRTFPGEFWLDDALDRRSALTVSSSPKLEQPWALNPNNPEP